MNIKLELDINAINFLLGALAEIAYKHSAPIIGEIQRQTQEQMKPQGVPTAEPGAAGA